MKLPNFGEILTLRKNIMYRKATIATVCGLLLLSAAACSDRNAETGIRTTDGYIVAAYIWPSCHDDSLAHR